MNHLSLTHAFAQDFSGITLEQVPADVYDRAKSLVFDTLGCTKASLAAPISRKVHEVGGLFGAAGEFSVAGTRASVSLLRAVYVNARLANLLDFDETFPVGVHFGVGAVAAALAGVEAHGGSFEDLVLASLAGYEAGARLATAIGPMMKVTHGEVEGFSPVWGVAAPVVLAACVAYAKARGVSSATLHQAIGIAGSNIPLPIGSKWSEAVDLPDVKYCDAGWCAITGVHGVESARAGLSGFGDILEGPYAIPEAYAAVMPDESQLHRKLVDQWFIRQITYKPWPTCRFMHAAQTALAQVLSTHKITAQDVEKVVIYTNPLANSGRFRKQDPTTFCAHQFSYAHATSMMVLGVPPGAKWFDGELSTSCLANELRSKVSVELYEPSLGFAKSMVDNQMREMPGAARIVMKSGAEYFAESSYAAGDPWSEQTRFDIADLQEKFNAALPDGASRAFGQAYWSEAGVDLLTIGNFLRTEHVQEA